MNSFLGDIPNSSEKSVWFYDGTSHWIRNPHSRFEEVLYIELVHTHFALFPDQQIGWIIRIDSVPSNQRAMIKNRLMEEGLPRTRNWLLQQQITETQIITQPFSAFVLGESKDGFQWIWKNCDFVTPKIEEVPIERNSQR